MNDSIWIDNDIQENGNYSPILSSFSGKADVDAVRRGGHLGESETL